MSYKFKPEVGQQHIQIDGEAGFWNITDSRTINGKEYFLAEVEADEMLLIPNCVIDENGQMIKEVWKGLEDFMPEMNFKLKEIKKVEEKYANKQTQQLKMQTGFIGHLDAEITESGMSETEWHSFRDTLEVDTFQSELDEIINALRNGIFKDKTNLMKTLNDYPLSVFTDSNNVEQYGFRIDTDNYSYLLKVNPEAQDGKNISCYCYTKKWLDSHIAKADEGIRFISSNYETLFRVSDGDKIKITDMDNGETKIRTARYIDEYHVEICGDKFSNLYHICEFAELSERNNYKVSPINEIEERITENEIEER